MYLFSVVHMKIKNRAVLKEVIFQCLVRKFFGTLCHTKRGHTCVGSRTALIEVELFKDLLYWSTYSR